MNKLSILFLLLTLGFSASQSHATHIMGGAITYTHVQGDSFLITQVLYRDCTPNSANLGNTSNISIVSNAGSQFLVIPRVNLYEIGNVCPNASPACGNATLPVSAEAHIYAGYVVLPTGYRYSIMWSSCCRNREITNGGASSSYSQITKLDRVAAATNNSPQFNSEPAIWAPANRKISLDFGAQDLDGDSLYYSLVPAKRTSTDPINYAPGFSATYPLANKNNNPISFNNQTGLMELTPKANQIGMVAVMVEEFRNGSLIGSAYRDVQVVILEDSMNITPTISGTNGTSKTIITVYPGDTINYSISTHDSNATDTLTLTNLSYPAGSNVSIVTGKHPASIFSWIVDTSHVRFYPYVHFLRVSDESCPYNLVNYRAIEIYVLNPDTTNVWPGDADNNKVVNSADLLPIGIAHGHSGVTRTGASLNWVAQPATSWGKFFRGGLNYKYADCDGSGLVDTSDANVINLHYSKTHPKSTKTDLGETGDIYLDLPNLLDTNTFYWADLYLSDDGSDVDIYGLTFEILFDNTIIEESSLILDMDGYGFGVEGQTSISMHHRLTSALDCGVVGIDGFNRIVNGKIGKVGFKVKKDIEFGKMINFTVNVNHAIAADEEEVSLRDGSSYSYVNGVNGTIADYAKNRLTLYPNPTKSTFRMNNPDRRILNYEVFDVSGKLILNGESDKRSILLSLNGNPQGVYLVRVFDQDIEKSFKLIKE